MFLINKGECCKPAAHSHRLSLQFLCRPPALPGDSGGKKGRLHFTPTEAVGDGATFYKSDFKGAACLAPEGWNGTCSGAQTLKMTANLHWIWSARRVARGPKNKGFKSKTRGKKSTNSICHRGGIPPCGGRCQRDSLNLPAKTDGKKHCHMKPQRRSFGLLSTSTEGEPIWLDSDSLKVLKSFCLMRGKCDLRDNLIPSSSPFLALAKEFSRICAVQMMMSFCSMICGKEILSCEAPLTRSTEYLCFRNRPNSAL